MSNCSTPAGTGGSICEAVAAIRLPGREKRQAGVKQWSSAQPSGVINDFVNIVMALPPALRPARHGPTVTAHFALAAQSGRSPPPPLRR